jgi:hypothetical protein
MGGMKGSKPWQAAKQRRQLVNNEWIEERATPFGRGIFARRRFESGERVCAFRGKAIPISEAEKYQEDHPEARSYWVASDRGTLILPDVASTGAHLANHSCNPNAEFQADTETSSYLVARRRIEPDDQVTVYYGWVSDREDNQCACGAEHCSGWIGMRVQHLPDGGMRLDHADLRRFLVVAHLNDNVKGARNVFDHMCKKLPEFKARFHLHQFIERGSPEFGWWTRVLESGRT